jgi:hypothetical protein
MYFCFAKAKYPTQTIPPRPFVHFFLDRGCFAKAKYPTQTIPPRPFVHFFLDRGSSIFLTVRQIRTYCYLDCI